MDGHKPIGYLGPIGNSLSGRRDSSYSYHRAHDSDPNPYGCS